MFKPEEMLSPEERDHADAVHWAQTSNPQDGARHSAGSDYVFRDGQLVHEAYGSGELTPVWVPGRNGAAEQGRARG